MCCILPVSFVEDQGPSSVSSQGNGVPQHRLKDGTMNWLQDQVAILPAADAFQCHDAGLKCTVEIDKVIGERSANVQNWC